LSIKYYKNFFLVKVRSDSVKLTKMGSKNPKFSRAAPRSRRRAGLYKHNINTRSLENKHDLDYLITCTVIEPWGTSLGPGRSPLGPARYQFWLPFGFVWSAYLEFASLTQCLMTTTAAAAAAAAAARTTTTTT